MVDPIHIKIIYFLVLVIKNMDNYAHLFCIGHDCINELH